MKTQTYRGDNYRDLMSQIKQEQGADALVVSSQKVGHPAGEEFGWNYEVVVQTGAPIANATAAYPSTAPRGTDSPAAQIRVLREEMRGLVGRIQEITIGSAGQLEVTEELAPLRNRMLTSEVLPSLIQPLLKELQQAATPADLTHPALLEKKLINLMARQIRSAGVPSLKKHQPLKLALMGPTGVGKTISLIKLAVHKDFFGGRKLGIITLDTRKIAAVEQLKAFARIAGAELFPVFKPSDVRKALKQFHNKEVILIDTAGESVRNQRSLLKLRKVMEQLSPDELHLVLPLVMKYSDMSTAMREYAPTGFNRVLLTKLDETGSFGHIYNLAREFKPVFAFQGYGQGLPEDILVGEPRQLAAWSLDRSYFDREKIR